MSKSARLVAAGCLVFLVYLLYSYHNLPQEGGEGSGHMVNHQEEEEENSGVPVSPAKQVLSFINNIWFILTLCHRWGWTFTTRCFARTAATLSSTSSGRPFKSICSVNISNSHQESFETLGSDCLMFFSGWGMHLMLDCGLMARQLPKSLGNIFKAEIILDIVKTIDNLRNLRTWDIRELEKSDYLTTLSTLECGISVPAGFNLFSREVYFLLFSFFF